MAATQERTDGVRLVVAAGALRATFCRLRMNRQQRKHGCVCSGLCRVDCIDSLDSIDGAACSCSASMMAFRDFWASAGALIGDWTMRNGRFRSDVPGQAPSRRILLHPLCLEGCVLGLGILGFEGYTNHSKVPSYRSTSLQPMIMARVVCLGAFEQVSSFLSPLQVSCTSSTFAFCAILAVPLSFLVWA